VRKMSVRKFVIVILVAVAMNLVMLSGASWAQGISGLSQLFGGGSGGSGGSRSRGQNSQQQEPDNAITIYRDTAPYVGTFHGKQTVATENTLQTQFACYPARDPALPNDQTFVCYNATSTTSER
jgi:hypothetical protein